MPSILNDDPAGGQRRQSDRRRWPTSPIDAFRIGGRRTGPRRAEEHRGTVFVDRFDAVTLAMVVTLLSLTILDGVLTIELLEFNSEEANPLMWHLLKRGPLAFLLGKYVLTAMGLPFLVVYKNYPMFGSRFRVGFLIPAFISLYLALVSYQWILFHMAHIHATIAGPNVALTADSRPGEAIIEVRADPQGRFVA